MYSEPTYRPVTVRPIGPGTRTDNVLAVPHSQVDQIPEGAVVFISQPAPHINACYGGLMSLRAKFLKAEGVVIDGKLRDLQEHRDLEFPV